jgi:hypothetical protein
MFLLRFLRHQLERMFGGYELVSHGTGGTRHMLLSALALYSPAISIEAVACRRPHCWRYLRLRA